MALSEIVVTGAYTDQAGNPASGRVSFQLSTPLTSSIDNQIVAPVLTVVELVNGVFTTTLVATNDPDIEQQNATYTVTERIVGAAPRIYSVEIPYDAPGGTVDLADLSPVTSGTVSYGVTQAAFNAHVADTTNVHGITDTTALETTAGSQAKADAAKSASVVLAPASAGRNIIQPTSNLTALIARTMAGQTAHLQQWQNTDASVLAAITASGRLQFGADTELYRESANQLRTDDSLRLMSHLRLGDGSSTTEYNVVAETSSGSISPSVKVYAKQANSSDDSYLYLARGVGILSFWGGRARVRSNSDEDRRVEITADFSIALSPGANGAANVFGPLRVYGQAAGSTQVLIRGAASQSGKLQQWQDSSGSELAAITAAGLHKWSSGNEQTTVGVAGAASAVPATPSKYPRVIGSDGNVYVIPAYNAV